MNVKIPRLEDISEEIHAGRPLGALLTTRFLASKEPKFNFHFNVITGIEKNRVYVNDSWPEEFGGSQSYDADDFMYGIHASAYGDLDNACLMKIRKAV